MAPAAEPSPPGPPPPCPAPFADPAGARSRNTRALPATSRAAPAPTAAQRTSAARQSMNVIRNTMLTGATALPSIPAEVWKENARPMRPGFTEALRIE